jgi:hypothetical protein
MEALLNLYEKVKERERKENDDTLRVRYLREHGVYKEKGGGEFFLTPEEMDIVCTGIRAKKEHKRT